MKPSIVVAIAVAIAAAAGSAGAQTAPDSGAFIGAGAGAAHWDAQGSSSNRPAWGIDGGYRWGLTPGQSAGIEAGGQDFGQVSRLVPGGETKARADAVLLGGTWRHTLPGRTFIGADAGLMRWHGRLPEAGDLIATTPDRWGNGWYAGARVGYDITADASISLGYRYHRANFNGEHANLGVAGICGEYRF